MWQRPWVILTRQWRHRWGGVSSRWGGGFQDIISVILHPEKIWQPELRTQRNVATKTLLLVSMLGGGEEWCCIRCHLRVDAVNLVSRTQMKSPFLPHHLLSLSYTFAETALACCRGGVNMSRRVCVSKRLHELCMKSLKGYRAHISHCSELELSM